MFVLEVIDHFSGLFGTKVRLLVLDLLFSCFHSSDLLVSDLRQDEFLVLLISLQLELSLGVDEHLLLADVTKESVAFLFTRLL